MSLNTLITNFVQFNNTNNNTNTKTDKIKKPTVSDLKSDPSMKLLSKYVRGGVSKMTKQDINTFIDNLTSYQKNTYMVGGREIIPDPEQNMIINSPIDKNIRVVAGAGTGKTTTITCRIKYLLDNCTTPDRILVLTFNVEARKNLQVMIDRLMGFEIKVEIRTIDSFCLKIKEDFFGGSDTTNNQYQYANSSVSEYGIIGRKIMEKYGAEIASQYKYVFFDEFQDVDEDQFQILSIFAKNGCFLTVIGDDSQNIYQFRGSDNYYIINFDKIIQNTLTYKITTNYRSTAEIVGLANDSIKHNKDKIFKMMRHNTSDKGTIDLTVCEANDEAINLIIAKITNYVMNDSNTEYGDIAILSRNTHPLKILETEIERNKLPYVSLINDQYSSEFKQIIQQNKIVLTTIHKAKGLEWKVVFLIGMGDAHFPNHLNNGLKNIEEERRLFYVGTTRAKRHLHFVTSKHDLPLSRFMGEIVNHIEIQNQSNRDIDPETMFEGDDTNKTKDSYSVMKIVEMLSGKKIGKMRDLGLVPSTSVKTELIFTDPLYYSDELKKDVFESDYGIFCDYYMTRQLMIRNKQEIKDINTEKILLNLRLTDEEKLLYRKYNIKECLTKKKIPLTFQTPTDETKVKDLINKLTNIIKLSKLSPVHIEHLLSMGISDYEYPKEFIKTLRRSYDIFKGDINVDTSASINQAIYHVSLCPKLNNDRRRLVYRDIQHLYEENSKIVLPRIDDYIKKIDSNEILCKLQMNKLYKIDKNTVSLCGELDYIDITNDTLVDIKCSESDFKVEWLIQLLIYYSLFMRNPNCCNNYYDIEIKKVAVINIFSGKYYEIVIPNDYDWEGMLSFVREMIANDLKGLRDVRTDLDDFDNDRVQLECIETQESTELNLELDPYRTIDVNIDTNLNSRTGYIVLDVENNVTTMDIIQFAYIVYDDKHTELKTVNSYIKDRFVDSRSGQITGITTDILREKGVDFYDVIKTFAEDVTKVNTVCGHHVHTDIAKIRSNIDRYRININVNDKITDIFDSLMIDDTSVLYKSVMNRGKSIALQNMYEELFKTKMIDAHDALSDVRHTAKCYVELMRLNKNKVVPPKKTVVIRKAKIVDTPEKTPVKKVLSKALIVGDQTNTKTKKVTTTPITKPITKSTTKTKTNIKVKIVKINTETNDNVRTKTNSTTLENGLSSIMTNSFFS